MNKKLTVYLACMLALMTAFCSTATVDASSNNFLSSLSTGVSLILDGESAMLADAESVSGNGSGTLPEKGYEAAGDSDEAQEKITEETQDETETAVQLETAVQKETALQEEIAAQKETAQEQEASPDLVMANVKNALNVRSEADEESEKAGYLYADCGGKILERKDGWTKLQSGNLVGWAKDEYLLFGADAEKLAADVGNLIVTIKTDALRIRKAPDEEAGIYGLLARDDELEVLEELDGWISVQYGKEVGYVSKEFVDADFKIDSGETVDEVKKRDEALAEEKAKLIQNRGAVAADVSDEILLAALIQCEAGNQPYEGQLAVGAVVMNRVRSGAYPSSINGVIYASGQFTPALNGKVARVAGSGNIKSSCMQAAREALGGASNVGGATHFRRSGSREGTIIGNHVFW